MKKKYVIITLALLVLVAIGICIGYIYTNNKKKIETDNIKGQYSDVIVTDMKTAKEYIFMCCRSAVTLMSQRI